MSTDLVRERVRAAIDVYRRIEDDAEAIAAAASAVVDAYRGGGKLILFGNGGSAADAQHIAAELIGRFQRERDPLPALALPVNSSTVTAIANDYGFDQVFARQIRALGAPGDVALAISTSGVSTNVLEALRTARDGGLATVGLTGGDGGEMPSLCDHCIVVPADVTARIQEGHLLVFHVLCEMVESALFPDA
jgi:D-sedoheptulose 7-phosphate isomerase